MPVRRLKKTPAHLEITAFINLIVVLVPFLLSIAVFTHLAVIDLSLPAQSSTPLRDLKVNDLQARGRDPADAIDVSDQLGGMIQRIPNTAAGPDYKTLAATDPAAQAEVPRQGRGHRDGRAEHARTTRWCR